MFIDEATIYVKAGDGGHGCLSFRREMFVAKGGPDGGDGGKGGDVYLLAAEDVDTLYDFMGKHHWKAKNGMPGEGSNKYGPNGDDLTIKVPVGTLIYDMSSNLCLKDMNKVGMKVKICAGGRGGRGNKKFASALNQTPREFEIGKPGQERNLRLELKLIADVGLVGLPNAGKSTLVAQCSGARPKIANYPFTTLQPVLGIVDLSDYRRFVMADIPGLIEGAHKGAGLGHEFLKHIERTRVLVHIIDILPTDESDPAENFIKIQNELNQYSSILGSKPALVVANKIDLSIDDSEVQELRKKLNRDDIIPISAATGQGVPELKEIMWKLIQEHKEEY